MDQASSTTRASGGTRSQISILLVGVAVAAMVVAVAWTPLLRGLLHDVAYALLGSRLDGVHRDLRAVEV
jgi:hypothetical protein